MDTKAKVKLILGKALSAEELATLKADIVKMEAQLGVPAPAPAPAPSPVQLKEVKTKDGKVLTVDGEMVAATPIMLVDPAAGPGPAPDGDYELEDGTIVSVAGGLIAAVKPGAPAIPADMVQQMNAKFSEQKKAIENDYAVKLAAQKTEFETSLSELRKTVLSNSQAITKILETPLDTIEFSQTGKKYEDMTPAEKYNHDHPLPK